MITKFVLALSPNSTTESDPKSLVERCVVVYKQSDGYGLTVTGENPVFVDYVKPDGAAFHAGIRQGDRILKVNGMPVTRSNHHEVVRMISGMFDRYELLHIVRLI